MCHFPLLILLCVLFTGKNHRCEYNYMLTPVIPPNESLILGVVWRIPNTMTQWDLSQEWKVGSTYENQRNTPY